MASRDVPVYGAELPFDRPPIFMLRAMNHVQSAVLAGQGECFINEDQNLVLYLSITPEIEREVPYLQGIAEVWVIVKGEHQ